MCDIARKALASRCLGPMAFSFKKKVTTMLGTRTWREASGLPVLCHRPSALLCWRSAVLTG